MSSSKLKNKFLEKGYIKPPFNPFDYGVIELSELLSKQFKEPYTDKLLEEKKYPYVKKKRKQTKRKVSK